MANFSSVNMLQINLKRSQDAQDLAIQTVREKEVGILVISEQNRDLHDAMWFKDKRGYAAIYVCKDEYYRAREVISGNGYVGVALGQLAIQLLFLSERHGCAGRGPLILAGDFNAKARA